MVGHQDESGDKKAMPRPHLFQFLLEDLVAGSALEERLPSETTECDEMKMAGMLIADPAAGHSGEMVHLGCTSLPPGGGGTKAGTGSHLWQPTLPNRREGWGTLLLWLG